MSSNPSQRDEGFVSILPGQQRSAVISPQGMILFERSLLFLSALATLGSLYPGGWPADGNLAILLGILATVLELGGNQVNRIGFITTAPALCLVAAILPGVGLRAAALILIASLSLRTVWRGSRHPSLRSRELLQDWFPLAATLGLVSLLKGDISPYFTLFCYGFFFALLTGVTLFGQTLEPAISRATASLRLFQFLLVSSIVLILTDAFPPSPARLAAVIPLFLLPNLMARRLGSSNQTDILLERQKTLSRKTLDSVRERFDILAEDRRMSISEARRLREFADWMADRPGFEKTGRFVLSRLRTVLDYETGVVFLQGESGPEARIYDSPFRERLEGQALLGLREPVVDECLSSRKIEVKTGPGDKNQLLGKESYALVFPLKELTGALYLGWQSKPTISSDTLAVLTSQVQLVDMALRAGLDSDRLKSELSYHSDQHRTTKERMERLEALIGEFQMLSSSLSLQLALRALITLCGRLVPHDRGCLLFAGEGGEASLTGWPSPETPPRDTLEELGRLTDKGGIPLNIEDATKWRVGTLWDDCTSYLVLRVVRRGVREGLLILGRTDSAFQPMDIQILQLVIAQTDVVLSNCSLHEEVLTSRERLERSQAQLVQSSKMAAVGNLAAGVAHELNTPLGAALLRMESAMRSLDKSDPDGAVEKLKNGIAAARMARDIVQKLLLYSREGKAGSQSFNLLEVIQRALELVGPQLKREGVVVEVVPSDLPPVKANPAEIQQVVINLLLNARDAILSVTDSGKVTISGQIVDDKVVFQFEDSGPGLSEEVAAKVFDPFFTTKDVGKGTGLGLSVSQQIVRRYGGDLTCQARQPGAVFKLIFG